MRLFDVIPKGGGLPVAQGVIFDDGTCATRGAHGGRTCTSVYIAIEDVKDHCERSGAEVVYRDAFNTYDAARMDCIQDGCENNPFGSVGGLDKRHAMETPKYIQEHQKAEYLRGYIDEARRQYGEDWQTCGFGWSPAIRIGGNEGEPCVYFYPRSCK